ncbi:MAG: argininosuccinate lyase [Deltaproteobacteria bacterium]|jgi:argininosuccinate lyase|nr:argininosuccinate lyase [Deltaproteobacteria bacterium]
MSEKLWAGRFQEKTAKSVETFTSSIDVDRRLYAYDIQGSIAHCKTLAKGGIISAKEARKLTAGLNKIKQEIDAQTFEFHHALEDIHTHIESRLAEIVGPVAQKLHTARSRNDQVALDVRLYLRDTVAEIIQLLGRLQKAVVHVAKRHVETVMPGYTHLQRAQPVLLAHHLMAYYEMFSRDTERLQDCLVRINVMPLGSAALAGTPHPIDRKYTAGLLGFKKVSANSMDAVADRDFMIEFASAASICMMHLSRLSEELIMWSSSEFNFLELPDAFATGSSIMPQKKNPDVAELVRGKTGRVFGDLMALLTLMKSLPLSYNRDMQEDKALLFDAADTLSACVDITAQLLPKIKFNTAGMQAAARRGYLNATDLADYLVTKGMPFREAHHCVGQIVGYAVRHRKELHELSLAELQRFSTRIEAEIFDFLKTSQMIDRRITFGGTATRVVKTAIRAAEKKLKKR